MATPAAPMPKMPWEEAKEAQAGQLPWEEAKQVQSGQMPAPGFGEQFMTRLGENVVGLGAPLADPIGAIKGMLREGAMAVGAPAVLAYEKGKQIAGQSLPENAADLAFNVGLAGIGAGLGKAGSVAGRGVSAGLRDSLAATMAKPPSPGLSAVPSNILRAIGRELMGVPEVFEGRGGGPPVQFRPEDLPQVKVVSPPPVKFRPPEAEPQSSPWPAPRVSFRAEPTPDVVPAPSVRFRAESAEPAARVVSPPPVGRMRGVEEPPSPRPVAAPPIGPMRGVPESPTPKPRPAPPVRFRSTVKPETPGGTPEAQGPTPAPGQPGSQKGVTVPDVHSDYALHPSPKYAQARDNLLADYLKSRSRTIAEIEAKPKLEDKVELLNDLIAQHNATRAAGSPEIKPYSLKATRPGEPDVAARIGHLLNRLRER